MSDRALAATAWTLALFANVVVALVNAWHHEGLNVAICATFALASAGVLIYLADYVGE